MDSIVNTKCISDKNLYSDRQFVNTGARYLSIHIHCIIIRLNDVSKLIEFKKRKIT